MSTKSISNSINMTDVANRAGVSQSTVSRVVNRHSGIRPTTRTSVLEALRELGYKANVLDLIQPAVAVCEYNVTVVFCPLPEQKDPFAMEYFSLLAHGIRDAFDNLNVLWHQEILCAGATSVPELESCDGCILMGFPSPELRHALRSVAIPYVIAGDMSGHREDVVVANKFEAGVEAAGSLLAQGITHLGFLLTRNDLPIFAGFQTELLRNGISVQPNDLRIQNDTLSASFIREIYRWIADKNLPQALFVSYMDAAIAVKAVLEVCHLRVPEDVRIISQGHYSSREKIDSIDVDVKGIGYHAGKRLLEKIVNPDDSPLQIAVSMVLSDSIAKK